MMIKKIDRASLARMSGITYAIIGLVLGCMIFLATFISPAGKDIGAGFGLASPVLMPLLYGVMGYIGGWLCAYLYNWVAARYGGVIIETE